MLTRIALRASEANLAATQSTVGRLRSELQVVRETAQERVASLEAKLTQTTDEFKARLLCFLEEHPRAARD